MSPCLIAGCKERSYCCLHDFAWSLPMHQQWQVLPHHILAPTGKPEALCACCNAYTGASLEYTMLGCPVRGSIPYLYNALYIPQTQALHIHMSEWLLYTHASCCPLTTQHGGRLMCTTTWVTCGGPKGRWGGRQPSSATARPCALTTPTPPPGGAWGICSGRTASTSRLSPAIRWDPSPPLFWGPFQPAPELPLGLLLCLLSFPLSCPLSSWMYTVSPGVSEGMHTMVIAKLW